MNSTFRSLFVLCWVAALAALTLAQQNETKPASNALLRLLQSKGIISEQEARSVSQPLAPAEREQRLAELLLSKGIVTRAEYDQLVTTNSQSKPDSTQPALFVAPGTNTESGIPGGGVMRASLAVATAIPAPQTSAQTSKPPEPKVIPAITPMRVLPITIPKKEGLLPDIKLGSGASLRPYGFFKVSAVQQTASHGGRIFGSNDFPQGPLLLGDTGPDADPQFHIKDRAMRLGVDFEWPDLAKSLTLTGKLEFDFEGNFTNVNNRNISANRSSQPSLRLAWVRFDTKLGGLPWFAQFGQDWSIFGSSTLMDIFETTGFGFAQGNLYERMPMFRTGVQFGKGDYKLQPEFAIALSSFGEPGLDVDQRTRFGGRVGPESNQPELQARVVFQFPFSRAPGVAPAQIIVSGDHARRREIIERSSIPTFLFALPGGSALANGVALTSDRNAWTAEVQLPTPWVTLAAKYYRGGDLRYYFMGQFNDVFTDLGSATVFSPLATATTFSGRPIPFGCEGGAGPLCTGGTVVPAQLRPVMGQGGFLQLGFPLSRILNAAPDGRNAGWSLYLTYGIDSAFAKDTVRANGLLRTNHGSVQVRYKLNKWVSFVDEETYLTTKTADGITKLFRGVPTQSAHAWRSEVGPIFTF
jgi:hypothetical protein